MTAYLPVETEGMDVGSSVCPLKHLSCLLPVFVFQVQETLVALGQLAQTAASNNGGMGGGGNWVNISIILYDTNWLITAESAPLYV